MLALGLLLLLTRPALGQQDRDQYGFNAHFHRYQRLNNPLYQTRAQDWFGLGIDGGHELAYSKRLRLKTDLRYYRNDGNFNYSVSEAYWNYNDEITELTIGRRILDWNPGEAYWGLNNALNPRQGFTLLGEEQEGLVGLHLNRKFGNFTVKVYMSYVHVPSLNPSIDIRDGKVITRSEWVRRPPERTTFRDVPLDIFYKLNRPSVSDVVFQKSLGAAIDYEWLTGALSFFAIYKPENNLRANAFVEGVDTGASRVVVTAEPIVNHHAMLGAHLKQKIRDSWLTVGFDITDPNATLGKDFDVLDPVELEANNRIFVSDDFIIEPSYVRESYARVNLSHDWGRIRGSLNYIRLMSGNQRGDDFFTDTVKWKSALSVYGELDLTDHWRLTGDYRYDFSRKDEILRAEVSYTWSKMLRFQLGGELIKSPALESYWAVYRANDTAYARVSFFF